MIDHSSTIVDCVCSAKLQVKTNALTAGIEEAARTRATVAGTDQRLILTRCEQPGAELMQNLWPVDSESLTEHVHNDTFKRCSDNGYPLGLHHYDSNCGLLLTDLSRRSCRIEIRM